MTVADGWTIPEAREKFAETGKPIDQLGKLIWCLPGFTECGYSDPGPEGGRRFKRYAIGDLQRLHGFLARNGWLDRPSSGDT